MDALIDRRSLVLWFPASLLLVALGDVPNTVPAAHYAASGLLGFLALASVLLPTRVGLPLLVAVLGQESRNAALQVRNLVQVRQQNRVLIIGQNVPNFWID